MIGLQKHKTHNPLLHIFVKLRKQIGSLIKSFNKIAFSNAEFLFERIPNNSQKAEYHICAT